MALSVEEALNQIYRHVRSKGTEIVAIESCSGRVLAQDITALHDLPPFDNSAMDGYALTCNDAGQTRLVAGTILAGERESHLLAPQTVMKIMTGARIPQGCEAIVPQEETEALSEGVKLPQVRIGQHIRRRGEDIRKDEILLRDGARLHAHQITLLASQGISQVQVYQKPRVAVLASGSELRMHFEPLEAHQLYNTNSPTFVLRAKELGCDVRFIGTAHDSIDDLEKHIRSALDADLIITSGGVSVGEADFTKAAFARFGMETFFDKVEIKPGKPTTFGRIGRTLVLSLPGNPMAAALNFELFGQSILLALSGDKERYLKPLHVRLKSPLKLKNGRVTLLPGWFDGASFEPAAKASPGMISPMAQANGWIMLRADGCSLEAGTEVRMFPTQWRFTGHEPFWSLTPSSD
ncbi:MAG: molybdopterin molybdotransferase MoeA [Campylobacterales bacterium]|nr:molybdopterin molybdotransferase MoeA [Campylobacterales bacterium]